MTAAMPTKVTAQYLCDTLSADQLEAFELKLKDRTFSHAGFLQTDQTLRSVVDLDNSALSASGITYQQIADKLYGIMKRLIKLHNEDSDQTTHVTRKHFELDGKFHVVMSSYMRGLQSCPFEKHIGDSERCENGFSCYEFVVHNLRTRETIHFGGLIPHLFEKHEFAQGPGCSYRLDPVKAANVLELEAGISYELPTEESKFWRLVNINQFRSFGELDTEEMFHSCSAVASDYSADRSATRFISNFNHRKERTEDLYMHIFASPGANCNFNLFENTRVAEPFYFEDIRRSTLLSFKQNKLETISLGALDKVLKESPLRALAGAASAHSGGASAGASVVAPAVVALGGGGGASATAHALEGAKEKASSAEGSVSAGDN